MLISPRKELEVGTVMTTKLVTGDEVIGKLVAINGDEYVVETPVVMQMQPMGNGQVQVVFGPFMLGIDDGVQVTLPYDKMVMRPVEARSDASKQYLQATSKLDLSAVR